MSKYTSFIIGALAGVFLMPVAGFTGLGWKLDTKAQIMASNAVAAEIKKILVPVCVAQFKVDPEMATHVAAMKGMQLFNPRMEYVEKGGWAKMPDQSEPVSNIARYCTEALENES
jgi:hypothetical protein